MICAAPELLDRHIKEAGNFRYLVDSQKHLDQVPPHARVGGVSLEDERQKRSLEDAGDDDDWQQQEQRRSGTKTRPLLLPLCCVFKKKKRKKTLFTHSAVIFSHSSLMEEKSTCSGTSPRTKG